MRTGTFSMKSFRLGLLALLLGGFSSVAGAAPKLISTSFESTDLSIHIGSTVKVFVTAFDTTQTFSISSVSATALALSISSPDLITPGQVYVTDGERVWSVFYSGFTPNTVSINNTNLFSYPNNPGGWVIADYNTLANQSFTLFSGTPVVAGASNASSVEIGDFDNLSLNDSAVGGDAVIGDGIWSGTYNVRDLGQIVKGAHVYSHILVAGVPVANDGFTSPKTMDLDMLRPEIKNVAFSTNKLNYSGVMYLSNFSQGKNSLVSANVDPTNAQGRFDLEVNKRDTVVDVEIVVPAANRHLGSLIFPAQAASLNGWRIWDGADGNNTFVADGIYPVNLYVHDSNGVVGVTRTAEVRVVSVKMSIQNITLSPPVIAGTPVVANGVITQVAYDVVLSQEVAGGDLGPSFRVLGWNPGATDAPGNPTGLFDQSTDLGSSLWSVKDLDFLNPDGTVGIAIDDSIDGRPLVDDDDTKVSDFAPYFTNLYGGGVFGNCAAPPPYGSRITLGDGTKTNDVFSSTDRFFITAGSSAAPTVMVAQHNNTYIGTTPALGSYRLSIKDVFTGLDFVPPTLTIAPDLPDPCTTTAAPVYFSNRIHFFPDSRPAGSGTSNRGKGLFVTDSSVIFKVLANPSPTLDNTPPIFLSSDPQDGSVIAPSTFTSSKPLSAQFRDFESSINTLGSISYARVKDPQGGFVGGSSSTNGGGIGNTVSINFTPYADIIAGGNYTLQVFTCNSGGLCLQKDIAFKVQDTSVPSMATIELVPQSGPPNDIVDPLIVGAQGPFENVDKLVVGLSFSNQTSNTVDLVNSSVSLYQVSGTSRVQVAMTRETATDGKLHYKLDSAITYAGKFEIEALTYSKDASGNSYSGPPSGSIKPQFSTQVCSACLTVPFANNVSNTRPAITGQLPVSILLHGSPVASNTIGVRGDLNALPVDTGFTHLATANNSSMMQFYSSGAPLSLASDRLTWTWTLPSSVLFKLYYDDSDLNGVPETQLQVRGFDGASWQSVSAQLDALPSTGNSFAITPPSGSPAFLYYAIGYAQAVGPSSSAPTPTPYAFKSTRSFNPAAPNAVNRKARFYYSTVQPKEIDVSVFAANGSLIRKLSLNNGVNSTDIQTDPVNLQSSYFFEWDGRNDNGDAAKNGLYLVRWHVVGTDGSSDTQVKAVALIK